jgi:Flp pilus assembly protein TadG
VTPIFMGKPMRSLLRSLRRFCSGRASRAGNVAIVFTLAVIPVVGGIGAAVDYSMANNNRASMQKALDATALALAKLMPLSQAQLDARGWEIFSANLGKLKVNMPQSGLVITTPIVGKIHLTATGSYTPQISGFVGIKTFPVAVNSQVQWGMKKLELALALDNTGSMSSNNKMTELKKAAKNLMGTLQKSVMTPGDVKVAIIPFHVQVRAPAGTDYNGSWLKWDHWDANETTCTGYWWSYSCSPKNHNTWDGCIIDRDQNHDTLDTTPNSNATKFPARMCFYSLARILPLTYDWTALTNKIDEMQPDGNTNVQIGLVWGWHALTSNDPLSQAAAANPDLNKYIILMTDGTNTQSRYYNTSGGSATSAEVAGMDARTLTTCTNIKAAGIKIYTIRVIDGNATMLRDCASDPTMYYDVQNASQLTSVFNSIGATLAKLHLSQ